uniref:Uncharacterized protein n=1 Tax=Panagrolaimus superbus TaxID=310955 RepID=A0A914Y8F6_9BILA
MVISLGLMIFCIRKYRLKRKELIQNNLSKKVLDGKVGGGAAPPSGGGGGQIKPLSVQSQSQKKLNARIPPKEIKITGKRPGITSISAKVCKSCSAEW